MFLRGAAGKVQSAPSTQEPTIEVIHLSMQVGKESAQGIAFLSHVAKLGVDAGNQLRQLMPLALLGKKVLGASATPAAQHTRGVDDLPTQGDQEARSTSL